MAKKEIPTKLNLKELKTKVSDLRKELLNLRFKQKSGQLENSSEFKKAKKNIARLLTRKKQLEIEGKSNA